MTPLRITCHLRTAPALPGGGLALDGILAAAVAILDELPPIDGGVLPIEIPVAREPGGRFHLATFALARPEMRSNRFINRRFPVEEAQRFGNPKLRRINVSTGTGKSYRIPLETIHFRGDRLYWWCVGDADRVRALLALVSYVGKKRSVGAGAVQGWNVDACNHPWEGFPVVWRGRALRPLPMDWPGLVEPEPILMPLTYPYWMHARAEEVAAPGMRF